MRRKRLNLIATPLLLALLVGGLGWTIYAPVRQQRLNHALIAAIKMNDTKVALALWAEGLMLYCPHLKTWLCTISRTIAWEWLRFLFKGPCTIRESGLQ